MLSAKIIEFSNLEEIRTASHDAVDPGFSVAGLSVLAKKLSDVCAKYQDAFV